MAVACAANICMGEKCECFMYICWTMEQLFHNKLSVNRRLAEQRSPSISWPNCGSSAMCDLCVNQWSAAKNSKRQQLECSRSNGRWCRRCDVWIPTDWLNGLTESKFVVAAVRFYCVSLAERVYFIKSTLIKIGRLFLFHSSRVFIVIYAVRLGERARALTSQQQQPKTHAHRNVLVVCKRAGWCLIIWRECDEWPR